mmetsp:Transcript_6077/g.10983  ORF Transcript_6077/g.10983 Transcript_6077/m.10983 type:complete len:377 (-) Transcript_6077:201-1331(-)
MKLSTVRAVVLMMALLTFTADTAQAGRVLLQQRGHGDRPAHTGDPPHAYTTEDGCVEAGFVWETDNERCVPSHDPHRDDVDRPFDYATEEACVAADFAWDAENEVCVGNNPGAGPRDRPPRQHQGSRRPGDGNGAESSNGRFLLQRDTDGPPRRGPPPFSFTSEVDCVEAGFVWEADFQKCIPEDYVKDGAVHPFQYSTEEACLEADFVWDEESEACVGKGRPTPGGGGPGSGHHHQRHQRPDDNSGRPGRNASSDEAPPRPQREPAEQLIPPFAFTSENECVEAGFVWDSDFQKCLPEKISTGDDMERPFQYDTEDSCVAAGFEWDGDYEVCVGRPLIPPHDDPMNDTDGSQQQRPGPRGENGNRRGGPGGRSLL